MLKLSLRSLLSNKRFTLINLVGLSISIAICFALTGYVRYQFSFDKFYAGGEEIYRVDYFEYQSGLSVLQSARTHDRTALLIHSFVPQVEAVTRVYNEKAFVFTDRVRLTDQNMVFVDSSFLKVFPLNVIEGSDNALTAPHSVMISKSQAQVYFGNENPMGKVLLFNERLPFTVTGVFEDIPRNTSIDFDFLLSWSTLPFNGWANPQGDFSAPYTFTFVRLKKNTKNIPAINAALTAMINKHNTSLEKRNHTATLELRANQDLHVSKDLSGEVKSGTDKKLLYALLSLAGFVLFAAWINYINLSLARALERANEIGVRKVFGASRLAITKQFVAEAIMLSVISFILGYSLYYLFTGPLASVLFASITFLPFSLSATAVYFLSFVSGTALIAFYPAYFISQYKPSLILQNRTGSSSTRINFLHQGLMIFQLFLAITIIGVTVVAGRQIRYMRNFDSGFNSRQTISLRAPASTNSDSLRYSRYTSFRNEVLRLPTFRSGTASMNIPGQEIRYHDEDVHAVGGRNDKKQSFWIMWIDEGYQETFGLTVVAGRNFHLSERENTCLISETAARALGYSNPSDAVNTTLITSDQKSLSVLGVIKDYHHESVRKAVDPIIFLFKHPHEYGFYSFMAETRDARYLGDLQKVWSKHYPNDQFSYYFMDQFYNDQYAADELFGRLLNLFSVISIIVATLGLFGMASLSIVKRSREIGVRKVLGASVSDILFLISNRYVRLIGIGCILAFPITWYFTNQWLSGFSYRISMEWWMIILPGVIVLIATLVTVCGQTIKAALVNPVKSLRNQN